MDDWLTEVIGQARQWDADRPRSQQLTIGWSGMSECRSWMGFKLAEAWPTDDEENWRAIVGTALHAWLGAVRLGAMADEDRVDTDFEVPVVYGGVPGHADEVAWKRRGVTDYKFPTIASLRVWDDPQVLDDKFVQVQGYAAGVMDTEKWQAMHGDAEVEEVRLLAAPVDGKFDDWQTFVRPFDRKVADDALANKDWVLRSVQEGRQLPRDKPWFWCENFCEFFTACRGGPRDDNGPFELIGDPELAVAVERYGEAMAAERLKKELLPLIKGIRGRTANGWKVSLGRKPAGKFVYDEELIERQYRSAGMEVPLRPGKISSPRIIVSRDDPK